MRPTTYAGAHLSGRKVPSAAGKLGAPKAMAGKLVRIMVYHRLKPGDFVERLTLIQGFIYLAVREGVISSSQRFEAGS